LGTTLTNENLIQQETERRLNLSNACYHSVQIILSSRLQSKDIKIRIYKTIILPVVLYACETWSLTFRVFEIRVLRRIFGPKRDEVMGGCRKLHNEELHDSYPSPSIIRMVESRSMRWAVHVAQKEARRNTYRISGKPEGKR
jgi:hypothetical protein